MTLNEILVDSGGILLVLLTLVEIAPVKINPWQTIATGMGHAMCRDIIERIDENDARNARYRIIRFNDEIRHDQKHTEEHFNQILDDIRTYELYCKEHPNFPNEKAQHSVANIRKIYDKCYAEDSFL